MVGRKPLTKPSEVVAAVMYFKGGQWRITTVKTEVSTFIAP